MKRRLPRNRALVESVLAVARETAPRPSVSPCPSAADLEGFEGGDWEYERVREMLRHALDCDRCAARLEGQRDHPDEVVLACYHANQISVGYHGDVLRAGIATHLATCSHCLARTTRSASPPIALEIPAADDAARAALQAFVLSLAAIGTAAARRRTSRATALERGVRRNARGMVVAYVYGQDGNLIVDAESKPRTVHFDVERAEIDDRRGISLLVSTTDRAFLHADGPHAKVSASLRSPSHELHLPPADLVPCGLDSAYPRAAATLRSRVGVEIGRQDVPAETVRLTVVLP